MLLFFCFRKLTFLTLQTKLKKVKIKSKGEFRYGDITGKYVIYRGENAKLQDVAEEFTDDVIYLNVEDYLKNLYN